ncbi:universal stress protein [Planococcus sp. SE5232]|uniref:universal stress protein n=1 Tax=unclassified Planococcus (in: firmicutes) TaxID=2662419 RepID=UPI001CBD24C1|nr:universal stress protein [Planococcus sp. 4-30]
MTLAYKRILTAIDGSHEADWAFKKSVEITKQNNAVLNLLYVVDTRSFTVMTKHVPDMDEEVFEFGKTMLDKYKEQALAAGIPEVNVYVAPGSPNKVISRDFSKRVEADLIVCGAQGLNAVDHYLMGSVSQHIVRSSPCDVLVVRSDNPEKAKE